MVHGLGHVPVCIQHHPRLLIYLCRYTIKLLFTIRLIHMVNICSDFYDTWTPWGWAHECNMTERCPFLRISTACLGKKIAFQYPVSELLQGVP